MQNKKYMIIVISSILVVCIIFFLFLFKYNTRNMNESGLALSKISHKYDLSNDVNFYNSENGDLIYFTNDKTFVLKLPKEVTNPDLNKSKKLELETFAVAKLKLTLDEACSLPLIVLDYQNRPLIMESCYGDY